MTNSTYWPRVGEKRTSNEKGVDILSLSLSHLMMTEGQGDTSLQLHHLPTKRFFFNPNNDNQS